MYKVINDDGILLSDELYKTKRDAKEFIIWHFRCLKRDGFLEGDTFNDFKKECYIIKKHRSK
jgi:hypothetical protein